MRYPITEVYLDQLKQRLKGEPNIDKLLSSPIFKDEANKTKAVTDVILPECAYDLGAKIVLETAREKPGQGILVFVGGMADIDNFVEHLYHVAGISSVKDGALPYGIEVLVLHSLIDLSNQAAALNACKGVQSGTKVVVATNIAESSLTLPNLTTVIDFGVHKEVAPHCHWKELFLVLLFLIPATQTYLEYIG